MRIHRYRDYLIRIRNLDLNKKLYGSGSSHKRIWYRYLENNVKIDFKNRSFPKLYDKLLPTTHNFLITDLIMTVLRSGSVRLNPNYLEESKIIIWSQNMNNIIKRRTFSTIISFLPVIPFGGIFRSSSLWCGLRLPGTRLEIQIPVPRKSMAMFVVEVLMSSVMVEQYHLLAEKTPKSKQEWQINILHPGDFLL